MKILSDCLKLLLIISLTTKIIKGNKYPFINALVILVLFII